MAGKVNNKLEAMKFMNVSIYYKVISNESGRGNIISMRGLWYQNEKKMKKI